MSLVVLIAIPMTLTTYPSPSPPKPLQAEPTVEQYFSSFNAGEFAVTAALFAAAGKLLPPFESAVVGIDAIAQYLDREAAGMQAYPESLQVQPIGNGHRQVLVKGQVKAIVFKVNVTWIFEIDEGDQIQAVEVKLLASMQELLNLRP